MIDNTFSPHFQQFSAALEELLVAHGKNGSERQRFQMETLIRLETEWRQEFIKDYRGPLIYKEFMEYIHNKRKSILAARPFFRERQEVFRDKISPTLRERHDVGLWQFAINYNFVSFAMKRRYFGARTKVHALAKEIKELRAKIIEMNMPLAISRAKLFKNRTPKSHLEYMDLVQIASEGLMSAVDKFVLPYTPVFRSVIIGRISGNHIESYSETLLHFYPSEKRKIYRALKARGRSGGEASLQKICEYVNEDADGDKTKITNPDEIHRLMSAASLVSMDAPLPDDGTTDGEQDNAIERYVAPEEQRPDLALEEQQLLDILKKEMKSLSLLEQKIIRMRGIDLD